MSKVLDLICASEVGEFFYKKDDKVVPEGEPVGVDIDDLDKVQLVLFNNIYWSPSHEEEEI